MPVLFFFVLQTGSVSTFRKYAFPDGIGFAARMKSVKLGMPRYMDVAGFFIAKAIKKPLKKLKKTCRKPVDKVRKEWYY